MTIAAGFVCHDGIVLCADSQESYGDYKWPVKKLAIPRTHIQPIMIAGAGFGPAIDTAAQKILQKIAMSGASHEQVIRFIEEILREIHQEDLPYYPKAPDDVLAFELLIAFSTEDGGGLYKSSGSLLKRVDYFEIIGSGSITNFFAHTLYRKNPFDRPNTSLSEGSVLAAYLIHLAKSQLSSIGGRSEIVTLSNAGDIRYASDWDVPHWERFFSEYQWLSGKVMLDCADPNSSEDDFNMRFDTFIEAIRATKSALIRDREEWDRIFHPIQEIKDKELAKRSASHNSAGHQ
jgi:hypothetical protein